MKTQLDYKRLNELLTIYTTNYVSLLYANMMLYDHLSDSKSPCQHKQDFIVSAKINVFGKHVGIIKLERENIIDMITKFDKASLFRPGEKFQKLIGYNAHSLRARALNSFYEIIKRYLDIREKDELQVFHTFDWFQMLYVLRNLASHADNYEKKVYFVNPKKYPKYPSTIKWGNITIKEHQTNTVEYYDKQVLELLNHATQFFVDHPEYQS